MHASTVDYVALVDEWVLSQERKEDQLQIYHSTCQITQSTLVQIPFWSWFEETHAVYNARLRFRNSHGLMLSSSDSLIKKSIHISHSEKFTECPTVCNSALKEESRHSKMISSHKNDVQSVTNGVCRRVKIELWAWISIPKSKSTKSVTVMCFCHKSCHLPNLSSTVS